MTKQKKDKFYLVQEDILPEAIKKTIKVKEILKLGEVKTINEAVEKMDLSRSAYYKYKDYVFPFFEIAQGKIVSIYVSMSNESGMLSSVLKIFLYKVLPIVVFHLKQKIYKVHWKIYYWIFAP